MFKIATLHSQIFATVYADQLRLALNDFESTRELKITTYPLEGEWIITVSGTVPSGEPLSELCARLLMRALANKELYAVMAEKGGK